MVQQNPTLVLPCSSPTTAVPFPPQNEAWEEIPNENVSSLHFRSTHCGCHDISTLLNIITRFELFLRTRLILILALSAIEFSCIFPILVHYYRIEVPVTKILFQRPILAAQSPPPPGLPWATTLRRTSLPFTEAPPQLCTCNKESKTWNLTKALFCGGISQLRNTPTYLKCNA